MLLVCQYAMDNGNEDWRIDSMWQLTC